jgi:hypothetical protein
VLEDTDTYHVFYNAHSFIKLEENFAAEGGAFGVQTLYLWKEKLLKNFE